MLRTLMITLVLLVSLNNAVSAQSDASTVPIDKATLVSSIQQTALNSPQQSTLLDRASESGLSEVAYEQYTLLWQKKPQDAYANLRRGQAAEDYWQYATRPDIHQLSVVDPQAEKLFQTARECLLKAQTLAPNDSLTNRAAGYFLFWHGSQMANGITDMKKAVKISPNSAAAHETLGNAYAEHSGSFYNLALAETELKKAIALNPKAAYPHWRLIRVYLDMRRPSNASRELQSYAHLSAPTETEKKAVSFYQSQIDRLR